jgi:arylsulfatase A-like enzyme
MLSSRISHILRLAALLSLLLGLSAYAEARVVGPQVSSVQSLAGASPTVVVANGTSTATMTVTLLDAALTPIAGQAVEFSSDGTNNFLTQPTAMTDAMGVVMGTIASTKAELKTITVTVDPLGAAILLDAQPTIDFIGDLSNVSPSLSSVAGAPTVNLVADGAMASTISITVIDALSNPVPGATVEIAMTGSGNTITQPALTDAAGMTSGTVASTTAESKTVSVTVSPNTLPVPLDTEILISFVGDANNISANNSSVNAVPSLGINADGIDTSTLMATIRDDNGNLVPGVMVEFSADGAGNTIVQPALLTDAFGLAAGSIASTVVQTKTITATVNPQASPLALSDMPTVEFVVPPPPNLIIIMADDWGIDTTERYHSENPYQIEDPPLSGTYRDMTLQEAQDRDIYPQTPNLNAIASDGVLFKRAYSMPLCSPSRACAMTGEHPTRHGVGWLVGGSNRIFGDLAELGVGPGNQRFMLPELIRSGGYMDAHIGKQHLMRPADATALSGWDAGNGVGMGSGWDWITSTADWTYYADEFCNLGLGGQPLEQSTTLSSFGYYSFVRNKNGVLEDIIGTHASELQVDDMIEYIGTTNGQPFVASLWLNAPHSPFNELPPVGTVSTAAYLAPDGDGATAWTRYCAMTEHIDFEIGRLMTSMAPDVLARTTFLFVGENGTPGPVMEGLRTGAILADGMTSTAQDVGPIYDFLIDPPNIPPPGMGQPDRETTHFKHSAYERGTLIPMIIGGGSSNVIAPFMRGATVKALVDITDVYAFVADFVGTTIPPGAGQDSHSFYPILQGDFSNTRSEIFSGLSKGLGSYPVQAPAFLFERWGFSRFLSAIDAGGQQAGRYKLIRRTGGEPGDHQFQGAADDALYLIEDSSGQHIDPHEMTPLDINGAYAGAYAFMVSLLDEKLDLSIPNTATYCACTTGGPCGNDHPDWGCENSLNTGARLEAVAGSLNHSTDDLVIRASGIRPGQFGLMYVGGAPVQFPFGDGQRCVTNGPTGVHRLPVRSVDALGQIIEGPGLVAHSQAAFISMGHFMTGSTYYFQGWYRDPGGPCGSSFNLTNGLQITYQ